MNLIPFGSHSTGAQRFHMPATHPRRTCAADPTFIHNARLDHSTNLTQNATSRSRHQTFCNTHTGSFFAHTARIRNPKEFPPHQGCPRTELQCEQTFNTQTETNEKEQTRMQARASVCTPYFEVTSATNVLTPQSPTHSTSSVSHIIPDLGRVCATQSRQRWCAFQNRNEHSPMPNVPCLRRSTREEQLRSPPNSANCAPRTITWSHRKLDLKKENP